MEIKELKVFLKLITKPNYRGKISKIQLGKDTKAAEREKICRNLYSSGYVDLTENIIKIRITDEGKILFKIDSKDLPVTPEENKVIQAFSQKKDVIKSSDIKIKPAAKRDDIINKLIDRGFIEAAEVKLDEVWLIEAGKHFLATECSFSGGGILTFSKKMFADYLDFIRNYYTKLPQPEVIQNGKTSVTTTKPTDEEILQTIIDLDTKLATDNYLPLFNLRNSLQPPLTRKELDEALYRLQNDDKIEFSKLAEVTAYSKKEIDAGIPQPVGGSWFFIIVNE